MSEQSASQWDHERYCTAVEAEGASFAELVKDADPAIGVPSCPGWTLADLIKHHGSSQRRAEYVVRHLSQQPVLSKDCRTDLPDDQAGYPAWFAAGSGPLVATLRAADPEAPMWTNGADRHVRYWARRILYEAVVHRADAELALGRQPHIEAATGRDGIDEFLTNMPCFPWIAERHREFGRDGHTLHFHATNHDGEWMITLGRGAFTWEHHHGPATVTAAGSAGDLLLLVYGRLAPGDDRFAVAGEARLLSQWLAKSAL